MITSDALLQFSCAALVLALPWAAALAIAHERSTRWWSLAGGALAASSVPAWAIALGIGGDAPARTLDAVLVGSTAAVIGLGTASRLGARGAGLCAALVGAGVLAPTLLLLVGVVPGVPQRTLGAVDFAGVLATHVAAAVAVLIASLLGGRSAGGPSQDENDTPPVRRLLAVGLVAIAATGWMLGAERLVTEASGRIALNAGFAALLGAAVWAAIAVLAGRERPAAGPVLGAALGWGAAGLGAPFLSPMAVAATVVLSVAAGAAIVLRRREGADASVRIAIAVIVTVGIAGIVTALLADGFGLAATGSIAGVGSHLGALLAVMVLAAPLAAIATVVALMTTRRPFRWAIPDSN